MGQSGLYSRLDDIETPEDALERALQFEKNTWGYYEAMKGVLGEHKVLDAIIELEKSHITKLVEYLVTGAKMRGLGDRYQGEHHAGQ